MSLISYHNLMTSRQYLLCFFIRYLFEHLHNISKICNLVSTNHVISIIHDHFKDIRLINSEIPIIFLTAKSMKDDVLEGFKLGADDYMTKPFSMEELLVRIEAVLRRSGGKSENKQE